LTGSKGWDTLFSIVQILIEHEVMAYDYLLEIQMKIYKALINGI